MHVELYKCLSVSIRSMHVEFYNIFVFWKMYLINAC